MALSKLLPWTRVRGRFKDADYGWVQWVTSK